eukprot:CAMPEP_0167770770 /NCGR_PEP_ID=MMETSP0110_2-20121227/18121_1 /TAXON_ID=629695 /ORGANISM="Gymnochlora sp., Strain CCMP2014" /LENGTH=83 /DNA_ID=CAMNT_0007660019 /DNA_START=1392 /DNA_END=1646 /DNA_ORIENTATION=-
MSSMRPVDEAENVSSKRLREDETDAIVGEELDDVNLADIGQADGMVRLQMVMDKLPKPTRHPKWATGKLEVPWQRGIDHYNQI